MSRHALPRPAATALVAVLAVAALLPVPRADAAGPAVTDGTGSAAIVGVVTRIPAEIVGGAWYASASVTVDKARARASGFYGGELVDAFLRSSLEEYGMLNDEVDATAENPEQSSPSEEVVGGDAEEAPARVVQLRAETPTRTEASAMVTGATDAAGEELSIAFDASTAESSTRVLDDDTVVTESVATVEGLAVAGVVEFATVRSIARVEVPVDGEPETTFETRISGVSVAGTELAGLGDDGLVVGGEQAVEDISLAELDPLFEALAEIGLTFETVPTSIASEVGQARVEGAALRFRYQAKKDPTVADLLSDNPMYEVLPLPPELGYDEEFLIGHVRASAVARQPGDLGIDLGFGDDVPAPTTDTSTPASSETASAGADLPPDSDDPASPSQALSPTPVSRGGAVAEDPEVAAPAPGGPDDGAATGDDTLDLVGMAGPDPVAERLVGAYQLLFLFALGGAAAPRLLRRAHA